MGTNAIEEAFRHHSLTLCTIAAYFASSLTVSFGDDAQSIPVMSLGSKYQLFGKLHAPLGKVMTVAGEAVAGPSIGYEGGRNLRIRRLQGAATQENIHICICDLRGDPFSSDLFGIQLGKTYELEGYETGGYVGLPELPKNLANPLVQTTKMYFHTVFIVLRAKEIPSIQDSPADFPGDRALIDGIAKSAGNAATLEGNGWKVLIDDTKRWPPDAEGKQVETNGVYAPTNRENEFNLVDGTWRLIRLEDQVDRRVALHAVAVERNGTWTIHYRGIDLAADNLADLPGWTVENHRRPMEFHGLLEKGDPDSTFIFYATSWTPLPELLVPDLPIEPQEIAVEFNSDYLPGLEPSAPSEKKKPK